MSVDRLFHYTLFLQNNIALLTPQDLAKKKDIKRSSIIRII